MKHRFLTGLIILAATHGTLAQNAAIATGETPANDHDKVSALQADNKQLRADLEAARKQNAKLEQEAKSVELVLGDLMKKFEKLQATNRSLENVARAGKKTIAELEETLQASQTELETAKAQSAKATLAHATRISALESVIEAHEATLDKIAEAEKAKAEKVAERTEDPTALAGDIFDRIITSDRLMKLKAEIIKDFSLLIGEANVSPALIDLKAEGTAFMKKIDASYDLQQLRKQYIDAYLEHYTPRELYDMLQFYKSELGAKILKHTPEIDFDLAVSISQEGRELYEQFRARFTEATSPEAVEKQVQENLKRIKTAADRYFGDNIMKRDVTVAELVSKGFLSPITPIKGERYTRLKVNSGTGILIVTLEDGRKVDYRY